MALPIRRSVAVFAEDLDTGQVFLRDADSIYPLASVFKLAILAAVLRMVDSGEMGLDDPMILVNDVKSPDGPLFHAELGRRLTVAELLSLMITKSDNTATDMLWRKTGFDGPNKAMLDLGITEFDANLPDREYFLISAGIGSEWEGLSEREIADRWLEKSRHERVSSCNRLLRETSRLSPWDFQATLDRRIASCSWEESVILDQAIDNSGSARSIATLLKAIATRTAASPAGCRLAENLLCRQESRSRIPAGLPLDADVGNKTGSVSGTANDAAIVWPEDQLPYVVVILCRGFPERADLDTGIADIASAVNEWVTSPRRYKSHRKDEVKRRVLDLERRYATS